jgi:hypothetical protein
VCALVPHTSAKAGDVGHLVEHPRGEDDRPRHVRAFGPDEADRIAEDLGVLDVGGDDIDAIAASTP